MSDFCYGDNLNTLCINDDFDYNKSMIIKPQEKKTPKLAQKFIFIDSTEYIQNDASQETTIEVDFEETVKDIVEIELLSCSINESLSINNNTNADTWANTDNYFLLFLENLDIKNYKICKNQYVKNCFARIPIPGTTDNVFFGRIKNFTNVYQFKPILQKLDRLKIKITDKHGGVFDVKNSRTAEDSSEIKKNLLKHGVQFTFALTYQTQPDLFD